MGPAGGGKPHGRSGGSFADMVAPKGTKEIGDGINKVIGELAKANEYLLKGVTVP